MTQKDQTIKLFAVAAAEHKLHRAALFDCITALDSCAAKKSNHHLFLVDGQCRRAVEQAKQLLRPRGG